jgi:hypothetical protein
METVLWGHVVYFQISPAMHERLQPGASERNKGLDFLEVSSIFVLSRLQAIYFAIAAAI